MKEFTPQQINTLSGLVAPDRFSTCQSNRGLHLHDISAHSGVLPAEITWPVTTEEVSQILSGTYAHGVPVSAWGPERVPRAIRSRLAAAW